MCDRTGPVDRCGRERPTTERCCVHNACCCHRLGVRLAVPRRVGAAVSACDCLECAFRRADREAVHTRDDLRLRAAMTALSRVMYWVAEALWYQDTGGSAPWAYIGDSLESGYFR